MDKKSFQYEITDFKKRGGKLRFSFGETTIPVCYDCQEDIIFIDTPDYKASTKADYSLDLGDNLDVLMNKLLDRYPQLTE